MMIQTTDAIYDGIVLRPDNPLQIEANTRVRLTLETLPPEKASPKSFLQTALSLNLDGPADWSVKIDDTLYGSDHVETC